MAEYTSEELLRLGKETNEMDFATNKNELLPCPFCGGEAILCKYNECFGHGERHDKYFVKCSSCGATGKSELVYYLTSADCQELAVRSWNTRTPKERGGESE